MAAMKIFLIIVAPLILIGCSASSGGGQKEQSAPVAEVVVARADVGSITQTTTVFGESENGAAGQYVVMAPIDAILISIDAPVGSDVALGQRIARLTASPAVRLEIATASSTARAAQEAYARVRRLRADGLVSDAEVGSARAASEAASATVASLSSRGQSLTLRATGSGYIQMISASPGDMVAAGTAVATVSRLGDLRARFGVDPALARQLNRDTPLTISPAAGGPPFTARILSVNPTADAQTRLASVYARIPARAGIGPGEALEAEVTVRAASSAVLIPYPALLNDGGQPFVFLVSKGKAVRRVVEIGIVSDTQVAITKGLKIGDVVVTQGGTALEDGMKVRTK